MTSSQIIPLPFPLLNMESVERKGKIKKIEYLQNEKSFLGEIKIIFKGLSFGQKTKNLIKNSGHKL